ncbi:hypothetical protein EV691_1573 [Azotobacter chroococcum]|jgi:hypothetical protein|uniref:Uncharacterized protein n=1 Tax=Azotobacter chroococcum TaxID=353 RepID=A0A4R1NTX9_9GAMM|nr:hypothetical protein EV691_1573 [Azotobacter chroococcum]
MAGREGESRLPFCLSLIESRGSAPGVRKACVTVLYKPALVEPDIDASCFYTLFS